MANVTIDSFDLWTTAQTLKTSGRGIRANNQSLLGIKKLRQLIFEIAAKGLLVEKESQVENIAFISEIAELVMGQAPPGNECNKEGIGTIFVKTGEFGELYPEIVEWTTKPLKFAKKGDVLICVVGATVGKLNLAIDCSIGRSVAAIRPNKKKIDTKYLYFSLIPFTLKLRDKSRGSAQGVIGKTELNSIEIRLPSLTEQHRIVAKVDELMAICDQLEQQQTYSNEAHQTLVETLLGTLTNADAPEALDVAWQRIANHFDTLLTTEHSIDQLKQTILQLAVMGKLVPQDPSDEPASELLKKIAKEKEKLVKAGKIKNKKQVTGLEELEKSFVLPRGWIYMRLNDLGYFTGGGTPSKAKSTYWGGNIPWVSPKDMYHDFIADSELKITKEGVANSTANLIPEGSLLIVARSGILKRKLPVSINIVECAVNQDLKVIIPYVIDTNLFIQLLLRGHEKYILDELVKQGMTVQSLEYENFEKQAFPIPPLAEQQRIIAKVNELFALCDKLKERLRDAQALQNQLAESVVSDQLNN